MGIAFGFLYIPFEALLLHKCGTTPGKWAMGMRLEWIQGGNLPYLEAIYRSWRVHKHGMAFGIPIAQLYFQLQSYCYLTGTSTKRWNKYNERIDPPVEMDWDEDTEIIYSEWEGKCRWRILPLILVYVLLFTVTVCDSIKPAHRSSELTIAQFAENYNSTVRILDNNGYYAVMEPDGTLSQETNTYVAVVIEIGGELVDDNRRDFHYKTENGILRAMIWENSWEDVWYLHPLGGGTLFYEAAVTALLSQPDCNLSDLSQFTKLWEKHLDAEEANFIYKNIEIRWKLRGENVSHDKGVFFAVDQDQPSKVSLVFELSILP
jgi:hypothetical protein